MKYKEEESKRGSWKSKMNFFFSVSRASERKMAIEKKNGTGKKKKLEVRSFGKFRTCHQIIET